MELDDYIDSPLLNRSIDAYRFIDPKVKCPCCGGICHKSQLVDTYFATTQTTKYHWGHGGLFNRFGLIRTTYETDRYLKICPSCHKERKEMQAYLDGFEKRVIIISLLLGFVVVLLVFGIIERHFSSIGEFLYMFLPIMSGLLIGVVCYQRLVDYYMKRKFGDRYLLFFHRKLE